MQELSNIEVEVVSGANGDDANAVAAGILAGTCIGFMIGGPAGAFGGAISGGVHAFIVSRMLN